MSFRCGRVVTRHRVWAVPSSETQGQMVGAREILNGAGGELVRRIIFSFRLDSGSLALTICPWVSEDGAVLPK